MTSNINDTIRNEDGSQGVTVATEEWQLVQQLKALAPKVRGGFTTMPMMFGIL
jgi:hypothetical protein